MYNIRYHIASLVGVFLALALGLVLGGLVVQQGTVERQQGALVDGLRKEFADLREENRGLADSNVSLEQLSDELLDVWSTDRLADSTILVVVGPEQDDDVLAVTRVVEEAGGQVAVVTLLEPGLGLDSDAVRAALKVDETDEDAVSSVATSLVAEWGFSLERTPVTEALIEAGVLRVDGLASSDAAAGLVCLAVAEDAPDEAGIALATAFERVGPAVAAERSDSLTGVARAGHKVKLAALDHLGTTPGRYTLVSLLTGADPGLYGTEQDASAVFPGAR